MDKFKKSKYRLLNLLTANMEQGTIDYVLQEIQQAAPEIVPTSNELHTFFQSPDGPTNLTAYQQILAMDKLLEYVEVSLRTLCDLIRYQQLKKFGVIHSVEEFVDLFHPDEKEDQK